MYHLCTASNPLGKSSSCFLNFPCPLTFFSVPNEPRAFPPGSFEGPEQRPERRQQCRRRSAGRSRGRWPTGRRSSPWRPFACTAASEQSSETERDSVLFRSFHPHRAEDSACQNIGWKRFTCMNGQYISPVWKRKNCKILCRFKRITEPLN